MKATYRPSGQSTQYGLRHLILLFVAWKLLLLFIACASPGTGYDTSTRILLDQYRPEARGWAAKSIEHAVLRLTRWDGIYFTTSAERGHVNEQDWAFSWTLASVTGHLAKSLLSRLTLSPIIKCALVGIGLSHITHLLAVLVLFQLTKLLIPSSTSRLAFVAASLHILSPAGIFLSAPYGESSFACFNFTGILCYAMATRERCSPPAKKEFALAEALYIILAGVCFESAAMMRSNGLLSGIIFAWDVVEFVLQPRRLFQDVGQLARLVATGIAGVLVGVGFALPQVVAYTEYCTNGRTRPWCGRMLPSIYSWVQDHYWGVGFLRYWTLNNLPLFLLAAPLLTLLVTTGFVALLRPKAFAATFLTTSPSKYAQDEEAVRTERKPLIHLLPRIALPQLILALLAATSFHVQIINRISSGYPLWYIFLAVALHSSTRVPAKAQVRLPASNGNAKAHSKDGAQLLAPARNVSFLNQQYLQWTVRAMVMYAIVQGGLYASFLPPA